MERVVGVPAPVTSDDALVTEAGVETPRAVITGTEHSPPGLSPGAVLAHEDGGLGRAEAEPDGRAARTGRLGRYLEVDASGLGEVRHDAGVYREAEARELPAPPDRLEARPHEVAGLGRHRLQRRETKDVDPRKGAASERHVEPLRERLHLWEFGHPASSSGACASKPIAASSAAAARRTVMSA